MARKSFLILLMAVAAAWAAEDAWSKVKALKTGTELRVYHMGSAKPVSAEMVELTDDNLVVIVKKTETAIKRVDIDRVEARPQGGRATMETVTKETSPDARSASEQQAGRGVDAPATTTSTSVSVGSKPDFEVVYRRASGAPRK